MDANDVGADLKEVLIPAERLQTRVTELAAQIDADYAGRELLLVGVLKGAVMVMADLARAMHLPVQMDWMAISSYGSGTKSSGVVRRLGSQRFLRRIVFPCPSWPHTPPGPVSR